MTDTDGSLLRRLVSALFAAAGLSLLARCGNPTAPPPPPPNTAPVVRSVTASPAQVEAGQEVTATANVEDTETPAELLRYEWMPDPAGGTISGVGRVVRWRAPIDGPVPSDYVLRVTVVDGALSATGATQSVRVNDGPREMRQLSETFLADFSDSTKTAEFCVRNFTTSCRGRQEELDDITHNRQTFTILESNFNIASVQMHPSPPPFFCTAPGGLSSCALVIAPARFVSLDRTNNKIEEARGDAWLTGIYENGKWWLCDSRFFGSPTATLNGRFLR